MMMSENIEQRMRSLAESKPDNLASVYPGDIVELLDERDKIITAARKLASAAEQYKAVSSFIEIGDKCFTCGADETQSHDEKCKFLVAEKEIESALAAFRAADQNTVTKRTESQIELAEQQFTGFHHAAEGYDIVSLVEAMGLHADEWEKLKVDMPWLSEKYVKQVDEHFNQAG